MLESTLAKLDKYHLLILDDIAYVSKDQAETSVYRRNRLVDRWPVGWPSETVFFSPHGGPVLRDAVALALQIYDFASFAGQFLQGPIDLRRTPQLRDRLMIEVRNEIARNPGAQIQPF
jgi:hypothetical protein